MFVMPGRAFISYRRDDTSGYAGRIYDRLQQRFPHQIFMDVSGIDGGVDFVETIENEVKASSVLVALIGKHWLEGKRLRHLSVFRCKYQESIHRLPRQGQQKEAVTWYLCVMT